MTCLLATSGDIITGAIVADKSKRGGLVATLSGNRPVTFESCARKIVDRLLDHKRIGGRFHVTERGDALTRVENGEEYEQIYLGKIDDLDGELVPDGAEEYSIDLQPDGLEPGDLWPSIYDGSRYSFVGDRFWWHSGQSHKRHPVPDGLPTDIEQGLQRYKRDGGSFRVLPWGDVITLVPIHPTQKRSKSSSMSFRGSSAT